MEDGEGRGSVSMLRSSNGDEERDGLRKLEKSRSVGAARVGKLSC